jgi:hypothetical protein
MERLAYLYKIIVVSLSLFLLIPQIALADTSVDVSNNGDGSSNSVSVNSQSSGENTTCVNGNCTTTGGGGTSTVCVNGQCTTSDGGNIDYSSPDGHDQVHVHNNTGDNSITISPIPTVDSTSISPSPTDTPEPSITPDPTITKMRNDINQHVAKEIEGVKKHLKDQNAAISGFFKTEIDALDNLLNGLFK